MANKSKLNAAAVKIGKTVGRAERKARKVAKAGRVAKEELRELTGQIEAFARELKKSSERLRRALR